MIEDRRDRLDRASKGPFDAGANNPPVEGAVKNSMGGVNSRDTQGILT